MHRAIFDSFGDKGIRAYVFIAGGIVITIGFFIASLSGEINLDTSNYSQNKPYINFTGLVKNPMNPDQLMEGSISTVGDIRAMLLREEDKYILKAEVINASLKKVPNKVWNMKNLKELDLSKNKLKQINKDSLKQLNSLERLTLSGNPIPPQFIQELGEELPGVNIIF